MNIIKWLCASTLFASITSAQAAEAQDTTVRAAAIERMQSKLGELRGTIAITSRFTRLTNDMIDQRKPVTPADGIIDAEQALLPREE